MAQKPETRFRNSKVVPFLRTLKNLAAFPIQQLAITGDPDYLLCINGHFVGLELKQAGGEPRPLQLYKLRQIQKAGGTAIAASPDNWEEVKTRLRKLDERASV